MANDIERYIVSHYIGVAMTRKGKPAVVEGPVSVNVEYAEGQAVYWLIVQREGEDNGVCCPASPPGWSPGTAVEDGGRLNDLVRSVLGVA